MGSYEVVGVVLAHGFLRGGRSGASSWVFKGW